MMISQNEVNHGILQMLTKPMGVEEVVADPLFAKLDHEIAFAHAMAGLTDLQTMKLVVCDQEKWFLTAAGRERLKGSKRGGRARL